MINSFHNIHLPILLVNSFALSINTNNLKKSDAIKVIIPVKSGSSVFSSVKYIWRKLKNG